MIRVRATTRVDATSRCVCALVVLGSFAAGCDLRGRPNPDDRPVPANAVVDFDTLYRVNCAGCHGAEGSFGAAPPLNDQLFLEIVPDETLHEVIRRGREGTPMPAFSTEYGGTLTDEQVQALANGLKSHWLEGAKSEAKNAPAYLVGNEMTIGEETALGAQLFADACAGCHGENGQGGSAGPLDDASFLALISDQALRRIVITGRPDLGMPTFAGDDGRDGDFKPLTSRQVSAIVALLAEWRAASPAQAGHGPLVGEARHGAKQ
ncbi:MAG TPA: c-type cytochrome [Pirellulales bacterium]|nr:c-type cytochrome [Pirellulales bacterium]